MKSKERYYSLIDHRGNFELRDYKSGIEFHSLFELDDLLNQQDNNINLLLKENQRLKEKLKLAKLSKKWEKEQRLKLQIHLDKQKNRR